MCGINSPTFHAERIKMPIEIAGGLQSDFLFCLMCNFECVYIEESLSQLRAVH